MNSSERWDAYVRLAQKYLDTGNLDTDEYAYKLEIGKNTASARDAVLREVKDWAHSLENALEKEQPIPWRGYTFRKFNQWYIDQPQEALKALRSIWTEDEESNDASIPRRIRAFCGVFTDEVISGPGTRATVASALLMALDVKRFPPFRIRIFENAYKFTDYDQPPNKMDEAVLYTHALGFLDQFLEEAEERGLAWPYRDRLAAQSVVWQIDGRVRRQLEERKKPNGNVLKVEPKQTSVDPPSLEELAESLFLSLPLLEKIETLLDDKRQVIFQGPPGTGKTYVALALAKCLAGSTDRVTLVQFHPSYSYEDFVRGFRPALVNGQASFTLQDGPLLRAAGEARAEAEMDPDAKHFLIIDEINRGNLAKVFGELYFLLEYRDEKISLQYQRTAGETFSLPENLYIIGTMYTADRSIALVDLALRRRFYFIEFHPDNEPVKSVLGRWLKEKAPDMKWVAKVVDEANELLKDDRHAAIGPSYFIKQSLDKEGVRRIWLHSVLPYIEERLFGDESRIKQFNLKTLCKKVAPHITWDDDEEQEDKDSGNNVDSNADNVNDAQDRPEGARDQQTA